MPINYTEIPDVLQAEMEWLQKVIATRLQFFFEQETTARSLYEIHPPDLAEAGGSYAEFVKNHALKFPERLVLALSLAPHIKPEILDVFFTKNSTYDRAFTEFGGLRGKGHSGFIPTGETALFLFGGTDFRKRLLVQYVFSGHFLFAKEHVLSLANPEAGETRFSGALNLAREFIDLFTLGYAEPPSFSTDFPARRLTTQMDWEDVVLHPNTVAEVSEIRDWIEHSEELLVGLGLGKRLSPGYKVLFYGPPGTGKTLTASLLGKSTGRDVYRIDLSLMVSKYIGETEKNLAKVFDKAHNKDWILFFDEADALFGKRTDMNSSHDRFANQEVAYLLQRIEDFPGVAILASNLKENIDNAFSRRFQAMIHFPIPGKEERLQLWTQAFPKGLSLDEQVDLESLAERYTLAGGAMMNVVRYCSLASLKRKDRVIRIEDIEAGLRRELEKEGKMLL